MTRTMIEMETPGRVLVRLVCPECGVVNAVMMEVMAELKTSRGLDDLHVAQLTPRIKKQKVAHHCRQSTMDDVIDRA